MTTRTEHFRALATHAWFKRVFARLTKQEIADCEYFLLKYKELDALAFEYMVNRMFLDVDPKPKHWAEMMDLVGACANVASQG